MVTAIPSSSQTPGAMADTGQAKPPAGGLDVELANCERQLSDWVHCASAKTPEGKAKIEELTAKHDAIKAKMQVEEQAAAKRQEAEKATATAHVNPALPSMGVYLDLYI